MIQQIVDEEFRELKRKAAAFDKIAKLRSEYDHYKSQMTEEEFLDKMEVLCKKGGAG